MTQSWEGLNVFLRVAFLKVTCDKWHSFMYSTIDEQVYRGVIEMCYFK